MTCEKADTLHKEIYINAQDSHLRQTLYPKIFVTLGDQNTFWPCLNFKTL